jgi:pimeloyl-ACP methyl ester carboxylesterase
MEAVSHHGRTTAYRIAGDPDAGSVTLAVHGSGGTHRVWAPQYGPDGLRPIAALDLSGHGESEDVDTESGAETLAAYVEDVAAVADAVEADVLVGNSLGGAVVLQALLDDAIDPAGIVLQGSGAKLTVHEGLREWLAADFDRAIEALHGPNRLFHDAPQTVLERSKVQLRATGRAVTERDFLTCHRFDVRDRLGEIETSLLALVGEHDQLTPVSFHEYLAENVQHGRVSVLEGAAHLAMLERPAAVTEEIAAFTGRVSQ